MIVLLDHMSASLIGAAVMFLIISMNMQMQETVIERTVHYTAKRYTIATGAWLQEDVSNIGAGMGDITTPGEAIDDLTVADGRTQTLVFRRWVNASDTGPSTIRYTLSLRDTLQVHENGAWKTLPLYQINRTVNGQPAGQSPPTVTDFDVELLDEQGEVTPSKASARLVRLRLSMAVQLAERQKYIRENHWATTVPLRTTTN